MPFGLYLLELLYLIIILNSASPWIWPSFKIGKQNFFFLFTGIHNSSSRGKHDINYLRPKKAFSFYFPLSAADLTEFWSSETKKMLIWMKIKVHWYENLGQWWETPSTLYSTGLDIFLCWILESLTYTQCIHAQSLPKIENSLHNHFHRKTKWIWVWAVSLKHGSFSLLFFNW